MTDAIKLPGTEMEVIEKYPLSRRLDHPSFGDVCKTTFAKAVITDFEKISDDPIAVQPRVKVTGDFGESDYLPLFFHPKAKYWDGEAGVIFDEDLWERVGWASPAYDATAYDEETGSFRKAWMSFRCGDEVAVMLKEENPVAVLGFADGVPRVGEDIVRLEGSKKVWVRMSKAEDYPDGDTGPDALDLGLKLEVEKINEVITEPQNQGIRAVLRASRTASCRIFSQYYDDGGGAYHTEEVHYTPYTDTWTDQYLMASYILQVWLIKVGAILYLIGTKYVGDYTTEDKDFETGVSEGYPALEDYFGSCEYGHAVPLVPMVPYDFNTCTDLEAAHQATIAEMCVPHPDWYDNFNPIPIGDYTSKENEMTFFSYAAVYSDKLYKDTKDNPPTWDMAHSPALNPPDGFTLQSGLDDYLGTLHSDLGFHVKADSGGPKFFIRPHTEVELEDAGMWPAGAS